LRRPAIDSASFEKAVDASLRRVFLEWDGPMVLIPVEEMKSRVNSVQVAPLLRSEGVVGH
jgi:hypothetical protein